MKKFVSVLAILLSMCLYSNWASAQYTVKGDFSSTKLPDSNGESWYRLECKASENYCGMFGKTYPDGSIHFAASDGTEWRIYFTVVYNDEATITVQLENGGSVFAIED